MGIRVSVKGCFFEWYKVLLPLRSCKTAFEGTFWHFDTKLVDKEFLWHSVVPQKRFQQHFGLIGVTTTLETLITPYNKTLQWIRHTISAKALKYQTQTKTLHKSEHSTQIYTPQQQHLPLFPSVSTFKYTLHISLNHN